jgi:6-phosphogluconate dehydrogenase
MKKELAIIGLGKMGGNAARHLVEKDWHVVGFNRTPIVTKELEREGVDGTYSFAEIMQKLKSPRVFWLMLPAGSVVDKIIFGRSGLIRFAKRGDIIIDAGNSFYKDAARRAKRLKAHGFKFLDVGFSGGPGGARRGACLMVGGEQKLFNYLKPLFRDLSVPDGFEFFKGVGAGHFVKMVHNGIEYGMMQSLAEGFGILKKVKYRIDLKRAARIYNHGSVIKSRLVGWLLEGLSIYGDNLSGVSGKVGHTGEGAWTIKTAREFGLKAKVIEDALKFRIMSERNPDYVGKVLSVLRKQFGGHSFEK